MSCCASGIGLADADAICSPREIGLASNALRDGLRQTVLSVPGMHCAACIRAIEKGLSAVEGVETARANLSTRRVVVNWRGAADAAPDLAGALRAIGYQAHLPGDQIDNEDGIRSHLIRALAVAGFSSMNIMLFSVSVWAGADTDTRHVFQLLSAAIALPAVVYAGSSFYLSAWRSLSRGRLNMDVPVSAGVLLSFALSLYDTLTNSAQAYFEASTSLLFVLLAGRLLDHTMRGKAKSAVAGLARLMPRGADRLAADGTVDHVPISEVRPGMRLLVAAGNSVPADGIVMSGRSEMDAALVTGESAWAAVDPGDEVRAGEINRGGPVEVEATAAPGDSLISEMSRLLAAAEDGRSGYRRLADRAASFYAPVVHTLSVLAFGSWLHATGDVHAALTIAIAVLVITCPCALGLAVPMVQVVLARRLFDRGVMATDGSAFERLAAVDTVIFDKTGTLTTGEPVLVEDGLSSRHLALAGSLARLSAHPYSKAIAVAHARAGGRMVEFDSVSELPGLGLEGRIGGQVYRLGRPGWASARDAETKASVELSRDGTTVARFRFGEALRPGARALVAALENSSIGVRILSGDTSHAVAAVARDLGVAEFEAELRPGEKAARVQALQSQGRKVLMVGDGINDAPSLRAAHVSMAPSSASDIGRNAADFVFLGADMSVVAESMEAARSALRLVRQNFALAAVYNAVSLPLAFAGYVTPLMAAVAMSSSSLLVVLNALRLGASRRTEPMPVVLRPERIAEARA